MRVGRLRLSNLSDVHGHEGELYSPVRRCRVHHVPNRRPHWNPIVPSCAVSEPRRLGGPWAKHELHRVEHVCRRVAHPYIPHSQAGLGQCDEELPRRFWRSFMIGSWSSGAGRARDLTTDVGQYMTTVAARSEVDVYDGCLQEVTTAGSNLICRALL